MHPIILPKLGLVLYKSPCINYFIYVPELLLIYTIIIYLFINTHLISYILLLRIINVLLCSTLNGVNCTIFKSHILSIFILIYSFNSLLLLTITMYTFLLLSYVYFISYKHLTSVNYKSLILIKILLFISSFISFNFYLFKSNILLGFTSYMAKFLF